MTEVIGGLNNDDGNSCFINSILQSSASCNYLLQFLDNVIENKTTGTDANVAEFTTTIEKKPKCIISKSKYGKKKKNKKQNQKNPLAEKNSKYHNNEKFFIELRKLLTNVNTRYTHKKGLSFSTSKFISTLSSQTIINATDQQDAQEFLQILFNDLEKSQIFHTTVKITSNDALQIKTPFEGILMARMKCLTCDEISNPNFKLFSNLTLSLPRYSKQETFNDILSTFWNQLDYVENVSCNRCTLLKHANSNSEYQNLLVKDVIKDDDMENILKRDNLEMVKSNKIKQIKILKPPKILSFHFNRSIFDRKQFKFKKNNCKVLLTPKLNISKFCIVDSDLAVDVADGYAPDFYYKNKNGNSEKDKKYYEKLHQSYETEYAQSDEDDDFNESRDENQYNSRQDIPENIDLFDSQNFPLKELGHIIGNNKCVYSLKSIVVHYGSHDYGHYISYRRFEDQWWRISDESVLKVDEDEVFSASGIFIVFYEQDI
ncbi:uncharacterized protein NDAI_0G00780 [Naumovozyma dairenensis CBS 421]|uniref:ubiquitinyl hydrolase 1 n=1 Tax=Naumovozyma dairenensis (strain ATCC 10597 / BCRC 20456 / CBS 421 / NBRC 0211 / NRRL Y-12639) TaxID=1071378 RepID=G0WDJ3_NAUDC|nr:hypothetical protein NDAI_0G00780 [Naumovozyma dairenensis CBS 421]CCD25854.2 hypothetical protein NDAI_0G00780 [Naumovozyma dairenensis CBS 421]